MMKKALFILLLFAVISFLLNSMPYVIPSLAAGNKAVPKRLALVVGNGSYGNNPLANSINDAKDMTAGLGKCGFEVITVIDADRTSLRKAIRQFGDKLGKDTIGLFYYAGHGIQVDGINYLVPIGAAVSTENEVEDECLRVSAVLRKMETATNRLNIIILDACRNNPFHWKYRGIEVRGLAKMDAPTGSLLVYSTSPGSVSADGNGHNGLFTAKLLQHLQKPGQPITKLLMKVRNDVISASHGKQVPWESSSLTRDFYFLGSKGTSEKEYGKTATVENPPSPEPENHTTTARNYYLRSQRERSLHKRQRLLTAAIEEDPKLFNAYYDLGITYAEERRYEDSIKTFKKALEIKDSQKVQYELGREYMILGEHNPAVRCLYKAAKVDNDLGKQARNILHSLGVEYKPPIPAPKKGTQDNSVSLDSGSVGQ